MVGVIAPETGPDPGPEALHQLWLQHVFHGVLCRYAKACDERDWAALEDVFAPDAQAVYGTWHCTSREAIVDMISRHLSGCGPSQHLLGNLVLSAHGGGWRTVTAVRAAHKGAGAFKSLRYDALGDYTDDWVLTPVGWRIQYRYMRMVLEIGDRRVLQPAVP